MAASPDTEDYWLRAIGYILGAIAAVIAFVATWAAAIGSVGWVFGIAVGWIPAYLAALIAYLAFRYLWWLAIIGGIYLLSLAP